MTEGEAEWRAVLDALDEAVVLLDGAGAIEWINAAGLRMFGHALAEVVGREVGALFPAFRGACQDGRLAAGSLAPAGDPTSGRHRSGVEIPVLLSVLRREIQGGLRFVFVARDREPSPGAAASQDGAVICARVTVFVHELNQPLAAVAAYVASAQRLLRMPPASRPGDAEAALRLAADQIDRLRQVVLGLRAYVAGRRDK